MAVLFPACTSGPNYAPVQDLHSPPERVPQHYVVRSGDTLFSIAFRYGLDFRGLAAANGIGRGYAIYPGQKLRLEDKAASVTTVAPVVSSTPVLRPTNTPAKAKPTPTPPPQKPRPTASSKAPAQSVTAPVSTWLWPTDGRVVQGFNSSQYAHKGIDIAGKLEQPVNAAAAGIVVYAGSGLVGYGKLLIVKHNDRYLSAYAHNNRLLVKEGESVKQGQTIARMGDTGTDSVKLHFEIRKDGKPVNPVKLLPGR
ncbi:peptidoglycan DD-metalloendopeptidase family protein [Litorivivens lipolytica]